MSSYRLYCLDGVGKVASAQWFDAASDDAALEAAETMREGRQGEVWKGTRLVGRLGPEAAA